MSLYTKKFKANPPGPVKPPEPAKPQDTKRTFDARPKPSDDKRRADPRDRPTGHIDPINTDPLDPDPSR